MVTKIVKSTWKGGFFGARSGARVSFSAFFLLAALLFASTERSASQRIPVFTAQGDVITHDFDNGFTTAHDVYFAFLPAEHLGHFSGTITAVTSKTVQSGSFTYRYVFVVTDDKMVHRIATFHFKATNQTDLGYIGAFGSEGIAKLIGDALYAVSSLTVYVSRDTGATWQVDTAGLGSAYAWDVAVDTAQYVYAATTKGLFIQHPDSNVWHPVTSLTQSTNLYRAFVDRKNRILVGGNGGGLFLSTTNGASWSFDTTGIGNQSVNLIADDAFSNLYVVTRDPFNNIDRIFKSVGGSGPWQEIDGPLNAITVSNTTVNSLSGDTVLAAETSFGRFISTDQGSSWTEHSEGVATETFTGFLKSQTGKWFTTTSTGLFSKNPADTSWTKSYPSNGLASGVAVTGDGIGDIFAGSTRTAAGGPILFRSTDNGTSWNADTAGVSILRTGVYSVDESGGQHLGTSQYGNSYTSLLFSKSPGGSWTVDTAGFQSSNYSFTYSLASDKHGYLYITGSYSSGASKVNARVMRRPIGGGTWVPDTTGLPATVNYLSRLAPDQNGNMLGISGSTLYKRTNGTWGTVALPAQAVSNFYSIDKFSVDSSGAIFASFTNFNGGRGVYFTTTGGSSWTFAGLDSLTITQLISYGDSTYVSTLNGLYILRRQAYGTSGVTTTEAQPGTYALLQNYPNPFNPTTKISYQLPAISKVSLKIYDLLGREVTTLVNGVMSAGTHEATFDASRLASGIYFYRLQAGNFTAIKKLVLLK